MSLKRNTYRSAALKFKQNVMMKKKRLIGKRFRRVAFIRGLSSLSVVDTNSRVRYTYTFKSDAQSLGNDWRAVGDDIRKSIALFK